MHTAVLTANNPLDGLLELIESKQARVGIIGLGYVGLPLAVAFAESGFRTTGFDVSEEKITRLNAGTSYIDDVSDQRIAAQLTHAAFTASADAGDLASCDCIFVCVPTPLGESLEPDLSYIRNATAAVKEILRPGQLIVFESTTYPGCTERLVLPELRTSGLELDRDFFLAFSPERIDPGNRRFHTENVPRIVGGCSANSTHAAEKIYREVVSSVYCASSATVAETAKLLENTFRAVNIALVNEVAGMCREMGIDVWEVIEAASSKPYGFMPFYPGPGIGGHCIPLDPAYFSWRGKQFGLSSRLINAADDINRAMPGRVVALVADALNEAGKSLKDSRVLVLGVAYKKNISDVRESPALEIIQELRAKKALVAYHDPFVHTVDFEALRLRERKQSVVQSNRRRKMRLAGTAARRRLGDSLESVELTERALREADCVLIVTDHDGIDYTRVLREARLIVDTRNVIGTRNADSRHAKVVTL